MDFPIRGQHTALCGLQYGDEGKGKFSHFLSENGGYDIFCRYNGGGNAGHTIYNNGVKIVTHFLPVGIVNPNITCVLANGMVIDPVALIKEITEVAEALEEPVSDVCSRILISNKAHVVTAKHIALDSERERSQNLGTTKTGIGPTYEAKINRTGTTFADIVQNRDPRFPKFLSLLSQNVVSTEIFLLEADEAGKRIFFEGAQGVLLDLDLGHYPTVTSSNCTVHGVGTGAGFPVSKITEVIGVCKPYNTRVGAGPFVAAMTPEEDEETRSLAGEFGATTGRPRACGWLDVYALKYAVKVGAVTSIAIAKMDILNTMVEIPVCVGYTYRRETLTELRDFPVGAESYKCEPVFENWAGWGEEENYDQFLARLEAYVGVPVSLIGNGPGPEKTHFAKDGIV